MNLYERGYLTNLSLLKKALKKGLRLGYVDLETSPYLSWHYGTKKLFISGNQIKKPMKITSAVFMTEKDQKPIVFQWVYKNGEGDDSGFLKELVKVLNRCDLVIGQNSDRYDFPVLQNRLLQLGLPAIKNLITFDTLKASRRSFYKPSHKLDDRSREYGYGGKIKQDMDDAIAVAEGNVKKQALRIKYNIKDVIDTRKILLKEFNYYSLPQKLLNMLRSYINEEKPYCIKCSARRQKKYNVKKVMVKVKNGGKRKQKWQCDNCSYRWDIK